MEHAEMITHITKDEWQWQKLQSIDSLQKMIARVQTPPPQRLGDNLL